MEDAIGFKNGGNINMEDAIGFKNGRNINIKDGNGTMVRKKNCKNDGNSKKYVDIFYFISYLNFIIFENFSYS